MKIAAEKMNQSARQILAAVVLVAVLVLSGMAEPQVKNDLSNNLPPDLSGIRQASFTPLY